MKDFWWRGQCVTRPTAGMEGLFKELNSMFVELVLVPCGTAASGFRKRLVSVDY